MSKAVRRSTRVKKIPNRFRHSDMPSQISEIIHNVVSSAITTSKIKIEPQAFFTLEDGLEKMLQALLYMAYVHASKDRDNSNISLTVADIEAVKPMFLDEKSKGKK